MATLKISEDLKKVIKQVILDTYYPVGKLYLSVGSENPNKTIGGTWVRQSGRYLYAGDKIEQTGYTGKHASSTKLTISQIPSHTHTQRCRGRQGDIAAAGSAIGGEFLGTSDVGLGETFATGGGAGHTHDISTMSIYVWKRTA